jgi:pyruvate-formate lyase
MEESIMVMTKRLERIKDRLFNEEFVTKKTWHFEDETILLDEAVKGEPLVVRKALAMQYVAKELPADIKRDELIVGNPNQNSVGFGVVYPIYATKEELEKAEYYSLDQASVWGHHPPHYDKIITMGVQGLKDEINSRIVEEYHKVKCSKEALDNLRAMILALDSLVLFAQNHADTALKMAMAESDPMRRRELFTIYQTCCRVPLRPASSFQEALQAYWFTYAMLSSSMEFIPLARGDQFLYPYFEKDLAAQNITRDYAIDLAGSFLAKCNERILTNMKDWENHYPMGQFSQGLIPEDTASAKVTGAWSESRTLMWNEEEDLDSDANYNYGQSGNDWLMNFMVGGLKPDGTDGTNELSYLFLDLIDQMDLIMPTVAARVHKDSPPSFLRKIAEILRFGTGEPMVYNDDTIIPGFVDLGVPVEDARNYSNDGCWEVLVPGKSHFSYAHVENLQCLEWVLTRGESLVRDNLKEGLDTGDPLELKTWDEFYAAYKKQVDDRITFSAERRLENFGLSNMIAPDPLISSIMEGCLERGEDFTQNGSIYNFHLILITGLSHTVDSLAVIKKMVYEDKTVDMADLIKAVKTNWQGMEALRQKVLNEVPKFGNDDPYVDDLAVRIMDDFADSVEEWNRKQSRLIFPCGIGTFENYAVIGRRVGASVDGRMAKGPLAPNYTPSFGVDLSGPTAVIKSVTRPDLLKYYCGCPLDIALNSNEFEGEAGVDRLVGLIRSFCDLGGQILTVTSNNLETLRDAQANPEKHRDLRVRMGGLSAYFVAMAPMQQENIIRRFERGGC